MPKSRGPVAESSMPIVCPVRCTFAMFRGDTFSQQFQFKRAAPNTTTPIAVNVSAATILATLKHTVVEPDNTALTQKTIGAGITVDTGSQGLFTLTLDPFDTANLPDGVTSLVFDVQVKESSGRVTTVVRGDLMIEPDVTRAY
jgi:hypothetical protein